MKLAWPVMALLALLVVAIFAPIVVVMRAVHDVAGAHPYCIQVSDRRADYRPAQTLLDLSVLTMWAKRESGMYMQHHAVLIVGNEARPSLFHWSYRAHDFVPGALNENYGGQRPAITCVPQRDFADGLPIVWPRAAAADFVRFSEHEAYRIPRTYQARWSGGSFRFLRIAATAPDFRMNPPCATAVRSLLNGIRGGCLI